MRSMDDQMQEIMKRAGTVQEKRTIRKRLYESAAASISFAILLIIASASLSKLTPVLKTVQMQQYGSLLLAAPYVGYVVVGVLAFALGVCVTLFCVCYKKLRQKEQRNE